MILPMPGCSRQRTIARMTNDELVRAIAELEMDGQSVRGVLRCERGLTYPFEGWLGLIAALESCRSVTALETLETNRGGT